MRLRVLAELNYELSDLVDHERGSIVLNIVAAALRHDEPAQLRLIGGPALDPLPFLFKICGRLVIRCAQDDQRHAWEGG